MDTLKEKIIKTSKETEVKNNGFIKTFNLPNQYWAHTLTMKEFNNQKAFSSNNFSEKDPASENLKKIFSLVDFEKTQPNKEISTFLLPRKDWHISQGDYILPPPKFKSRKIFSRNDLKNIINEFWYILLSLFVCYFILDMIFKAT